MRKHETAKDYKTLTDKAVNWEMWGNLKTLVDYLDKHAIEEKLSRNDAVKVSVSLNNLLKDLGL